MMDEPALNLITDQAPNRLGRYQWAITARTFVLCGSALTPALATKAVITEFNDYIERRYKMPAAATAAPNAVPPKSVAEIPTGALVKAYVELRDKKEALKKAQEDQLKPFNERLDKIEAILLDRLNNDQADSFKTEFGTAYKTTHTSAKVENWADTLNYIKEYEAWDLLEARVNKTVVAEILEQLAQEAKEAEDAGQTVSPAMKVIPGVVTSSIVKVNVRRGNA